MKQLVNLDNNNDHLLEIGPDSSDNAGFGSIEHNITNLLIQLGEDPKRQGLLETPRRVSDAFKYLTSGYNGNLNKIVNNAIFEEDSKGVVIVKNIDIFSMCEHHLLPMIGKAHVGYLPDGKVIGLSKIPRICDMFSRRFQIQERITEQIAHSIQRILNPKGVIVVIELTHMCMMIRGVKKQGSTTTTKAAIGVFEDIDFQKDFFQQLGA